MGRNETAIIKGVQEIHNEHLENEIAIQKTISGILDLIESMREDIKSLRIDVDKLIENSCGCRKSA